MNEGVFCQQGHHLWEDVPWATNNTIKQATYPSFFSEGIDCLAPERADVCLAQVGLSSLRGGVTMYVLLCSSRDFDPPFLLLIVILPLIPEQHLSFVPSHCSGHLRSLCQRGGICARSASGSLSSGQAEKLTTNPPYGYTLTHQLR